MEQRCNRCNRKLKTPEAIAAGFGSACYKKLFGKPLKSMGKCRKNAGIENADEEHQEIDGQISCFDESEV